MTFERVTGAGPAGLVLTKDSRMVGGSASFASIPNMLRAVARRQVKGFKSLVVNLCVISCCYDAV